MSSSSLSASVTRILALSNFPKELKTRDILAAFAEFDPPVAELPQQQPGGPPVAGYKVKWLDDTNLLIVFESPAVAKKAYLSTLLRPHATLGAAVSIKPYDGPDAQNIIAAVNARGGGGGGAGSIGRAAGVGGHGRGASTSGNGSFSSPLGNPGNPYAPQFNPPSQQQQPAPPPPGLPQNAGHAHRRSGSFNQPPSAVPGGPNYARHGRMGSFGHASASAVGAGLGAHAGGPMSGGVPLGLVGGAGAGVGAGNSAASNWGPAVGAKVRVESPPGGRAEAQRA